MKVLVVGAGLAGLSAAVHLVNGGADVVVADPRGAGGKAQTREVAPGWWVEHGPHSFTHRADPVFALAKTLGIDGQISAVGTVARARFLVRDGQLRRASPFGGALRIRDWFRVFRGLFRSGNTSGSVQDWFDSTFGPGFDVASVATIGIWAAHPREVGFSEGFAGLAAALKKHGSILGVFRSHGRAERAPGTYGFTGGMQTLVNAAAAKIGGVRQQTVDELERSPEGWHVGSLGTFDRVVLAVESQSLGRFLKRDLPLRTSPLLVAHWLSPDCAFPHGFGYLAPVGENRRVLGTIFASDLHPDRTPAGFRSFTSMFGGTFRPADLQLNDGQIRGFLLKEHRDLTGREVSIDNLHVVRHEHAVAIPEVGHAGRVESIHSSLPPGLSAAGSWCGAGAMSDAITAGMAAATRILADAHGLSHVA